MDGARWARAWWRRRARPSEAWAPDAPRRCGCRPVSGPSQLGCWTDRRIDRAGVGRVGGVVFRDAHLFGCAGGHTRAVRHRNDRLAVALGCWITMFSEGYSFMQRNPPLSAGTVLNTHLVLTEAFGQAVRWD
jgi:hypothetical protein